PRQSYRRAATTSRQHLASRSAANVVAGRWTDSVNGMDGRGRLRPSLPISTTSDNIAKDAWHLRGVGRVVVTGKHFEVIGQDVIVIVNLYRGRRGRVEEACCAILGRVHIDVPVLQSTPTRQWDSRCGKLDILNDHRPGRKILASV